VDMEAAALELRPAPFRHALASPLPRSFVHVDGVRLAIHDSGGPGRALVCLHAVGHGGADFTRIAARFRARQRVITLDFPGHGASDPDRQPASARRYAELLDGVTRALGLGPRVLLGNSIGGATAALHASRHREDVRALVLVNSGGFDRAPQGLFAQLAMGSVARQMERGARGDPRFARWFARYYTRVLPLPAAQRTGDAVVASGYEVAPLLAEAWRSFARPEADLRALVPALTMPVLVAWARGDRLLPWSRSAPALSRIPDVRVRLFDGVHAPFLEVPDAFEAALSAFLDEL
jgi:pimeloyl-ACP methyl ester carboxylesterase